MTQEVNVILTLQVQELDESELTKMMIELANTRTFRECTYYRAAVSAVNLHPNVNETKESTDFLKEYYPNYDTCPYIRELAIIKERAEGLTEDELFENPVIGFSMGDDMVKLEAIINHTAIEEYNRRHNSTTTPVPPKKAK